MLVYTLKRFPHWTTTKHSNKKYITNHLLNLKPRSAPLKYHDNIIFKNYTGNEILYSFQHVSELRPSEISAGLLELSYRRGLPSDYDWNTNEKIQEVLKHTKARLPQYTSRVLTTLAYSLHKLNIQDPTLWQGLSQNILKYGNSIESKGLAYAWNAFVGKGQKQFFEETLKFLPNHLRTFNGRDLLFIVRGVVKEQLEVGDLFERLLYDFILAKKKMCSPEQLEEYLQLLRIRSDFNQEREKLMMEALEYKKARREFRIGGSVGLDAKKEAKNKRKEKKEKIEQVDNA